MSTFNGLPEELLDAILREALALPWFTFLEWSRGRPTKDRLGTRSTIPDILLVCKTWARVGQRHLYEGIVVHRNSQAKALASSLLADRRRIHDTTMTLAERIRRLRINGVQCKAVEIVLQLATNVEDLHVSLAVPASAPRIDWLPGLRRMSPTRLYLHDTEKVHANNDRLIDAIEDAVTASSDNPAYWNRLEEVHLRSMDFSIMPGLGAALSVLPRLRVITASEVWCADWWHAFLQLVGNNTRLQAVFLDCHPKLLDQTLQGRAKEIVRQNRSELRRQIGLKDYHGRFARMALDDDPTS
ncbi:hypothetical protein BN946_scf184916.g5 [Trametes cinnabarina]|uniref:F-box domain-containing protein n=1 Tax=Pycnoporus cinnabarinus TaxID=5643 RepID=A0A060SMM0_PYCCI|nr:hypothetical protein BN946_scf184916.g5 [Trametes cinnabarina]